MNSKKSTSSSATLSTVSKTKSVTNFSQFSLYFEVGVFILTLWVLWLFNKDYITPILVGFIFATLVYPLYSYINYLLKTKLPFKRDLSPIAALSTIGFVLFGLMIFTNIFVVQIVREVPSFVDGIQSYVASIPENKDLLETAARFGISNESIIEFSGQVNDGLAGSINSILPPENSDRLQRFLDIGTQVGGFLVNQLIYVIIFILAWFNALTNGSRWVHQILEIMPFDKSEHERITKSLQLGVRNVLYANFVSGLIHAAFVFLIMFVFGLNNIFIVTFIVFLIGFLPLSPSELAYLIPIGMLFTFNPLAAIIVAIIAEGVILWSNYILLPSMIKSNEEGNPLLILTSVFSGITLFGPMGFLIGPIIMIFIQTVFSISRQRYLLNK